jgi:hypothetical protein
LPEDLAREVDINWEGSITGRVYTEVDQVRKGDFPYMPHWPLYVSHDPGHSPDPYALQWYQISPDSGRHRLVASFEKSGRVIDWFAPFFGAPYDSQFDYTDEERAFIDIVREWKRGIHFGDQAGRQKNGITGTSSYKEWEKWGVYVQSNTMANDLDTRKTYARKILMALDINDTPENLYWLECISNARYPDVSENSGRITENDKPLHDWTSHHRTALEYYAVNIDWNKPDPGEYVQGLTFQKAMAGLQLKQSNPHIIGNE